MYFWHHFEFHAQGARTYKLQVYQRNAIKCTPIYIFTKISPEKLMQIVILSTCSTRNSIQFNSTRFRLLLTTHGAFSDS